MPEVLGFYVFYFYTHAGVSSHTQASVCVTAHGQGWKAKKPKNIKTHMYVR